jgi:hypothetical protein
MTNQSQPEAIQVTVDELPEVKRYLEQLRAQRAMSTGPDAGLKPILIRLNIIENKLEELLKLVRINDSSGE